jgi:hypothetical protein
VNDFAWLCLSGGLTELAFATYLGLFILSFGYDYTLKRKEEHLNCSLVNSVKLLSPELLIICTTEFQIYNRYERTMYHNIKTGGGWFPKSLYSIPDFQGGKKVGYGCLYLVKTKTSIVLVDFD